MKSLAEGKSALRCFVEILIAKYKRGSYAASVTLTAASAGNPLRYDHRLTTGKHVYGRPRGQCGFFGGLYFFSGDIALRSELVPVLHRPGRNAGAATQWGLEMSRADLDTRGMSGEPRPQLFALTERIRKRLKQQPH